VSVDDQIVNYADAAGFGRGLEGGPFLVTQEGKTFDLIVIALRLIDN
jgi:hypothetical protein